MRVSKRCGSLDAYDRIANEISLLKDQSIQVLLKNVVNLLFRNGFFFVIYF
ncbi:hypothetical protein LEP1GSC125_0505 [Leptospira mayottensis 200901122]|uniref:Uncharacterized protein n=1 Tax=Leptospira mayottensis 200901122 TaxID=1193010 RepID=A0AA87MPL2_9LEPT|nr:hypothetical protein LEP1GSC125_0505 [Leptospira mayottensis 200901122]